MKIKKAIVTLIQQSASSDTKKQCSHGWISSGISKKKPAHLQKIAK